MIKHTDIYKFGISPNSFADQMQKRWTNELGNISNQALWDTWFQIAAEFGCHIYNHDKPEKAKKWTILSPPTGSGKTQGTILYAAMLSRRSNHDHPGMLIVTRLIEDCDYIAQEINRIGSRQSAIAYHSQAKDKVKLGELEKWPVVVITHRAYELALDYLGHEGRIEKTWPFFHGFDRSESGLYFPASSEVNTRRLVVIDECLDIIEHNQVRLNDLRQTYGQIPLEILNRFPAEKEALEKMIEYMKLAGSDKQGEQQKERMISLCGLEPDNPPDLTGLIAELKNIPFDLHIGKNDPLERQRLRLRHEKRLKSLQLIYRQWSYYGKYRSDHTMNTARLLVPENAKGCVVMDATASTNLVYQLHKDSVLVVPPQGSRRYSNVSVHVSNGHSVGKNHMVKNKKQLCSDLILDLNQRLPGKEVLIVCHKDVEPVLTKFETSFKMHTAHWNKVDGNNQWRDCDTVVIYGFPYLPSSWSPNVFMALQGPRNTDWLQNPENRQFKDHVDIRKALEQSQLSTKIIQAINRIRCRKVIDIGGNCKDTDVYILLPDRGKVGQAVIEDIQRSMPGVNIKEDWKYSEQKRRAKASNHEQAMVKFVENAGPGNYSRARICKELGMSISTMNRIIKKLKIEDSAIYSAMLANDVRYVNKGAGQNQTAFFVKG